jgi:PGF-pre-PGF domain-containing protein
LNSAGTIGNLSAVNLSTLPPPPDGSNLLYGTFSFNITGLDLRGDVTLVLTFPNVLPPGTVYWKYQANHNPQWYSITPDAINGTHMTITLTDGGIGDDDGFANRQIHDPGGPGAKIPEIQPQIASSSGSTGGGGVVTSEPLENIARAQSEDGDIHAGQSKKYDFSSIQCAYEIIVTGSENENKVVIRVEELKGLSRIVKVSPTGVVYTNFNVWANTKRIKEALIRCKVENNWIVSNGFESSNVNIQRWNNNSWTQLETKELRKDSNHTYYEAKTNGFSHFTVTGLKNEVEVTVIPVVSASEKPEVTESKELTSKPASLNWILYIVIGSLIFSGIYLYAIKRK